MRLLLVVLLFLSLDSFGQNMKGFMQRWDDETTKKFHLDSLMNNEVDTLFLSEEVRTEAGIHVYIVQQDSMDKSIELQYSHNFDEVGYSLTVLSEQNYFFVFMNEGDHCCDWLVLFETYAMIKGEPVLIESADFWPEISWTNFLQETPSTSEYPFLDQGPKYYLSFDGEYIHAILSAEFYALSYEKGPEFLDKYGSIIQDVKLKWDKNSFIFI